jgi:hydrogenase 3 maturation protease
MLETLANELSGKVVILGVGNPLRGDDGAGPNLIEQLQGCVNATLLDCEEVPENFLGQIAENQPDIVLIIDAIDFGMSPGAVALLEEEQLLAGTSLSTHHSSLQLFIKCLKAETGGTVLVLGIQPESMDYGTEISPRVGETLGLLRHIITRALPPKGPINLTRIDIPRQ